MNTNISSIDFLPPAAKRALQTFQENGDEKEPSSLADPSRSSRQRAGVAASCVFKSAGVLLNQQSRGATAQAQANRLVAELYNPTTGAKSVLGGSPFSPSGLCAPELEKRPIQQKTPSTLSLLRAKPQSHSDRGTDSTSLTLQVLGLSSRPPVAASRRVQPQTPAPSEPEQALPHWEALQNEWHDVSSKISALNAKEKQTQEAWRELLKEPRAQELKKRVENRFQQSITVTTVSRDEAFFGCEFVYEMTPSGKQVNPTIKIASDLDRDGKVRCLLTELTNLSTADEFSAIVRGAMDHSLSREEFVQKMEMLELDIQKRVSDPIERDLESRGVIKPIETLVYITDPNLPLTDRLRTLRDRHNEGYGKQWDAFNQQSAPSLPLTQDVHQPIDPLGVLQLTGNQSIDDMIQGALAHTFFEHRVGRRPTMAIEAFSEAARKEAHSHENPIRDRIVSAGVEIGGLGVVGAATGVPGFLAIPGAHLLADGAAALEKTTQKFIRTRSPSEFALDGGGEYPTMYDMAVVGYVGSKLAQVPSKAIHAVHHKIVDTIGSGLDRIGITDANIARVVNAVIEAGIAAAKMDYSLIASAEAAELAPLCKRPDYFRALQAYRKVQMFYSAPGVFGGQIEKLFEDGIFINACASRISYILNETGCELPFIPGQTVSGKRGEQYIFRLSTLKPFLRKALGPPDCEWDENGLSKKSNQELCTNSDAGGIFIDSWKNPTPTSTGHAYLGPLRRGLKSWHNTLSFWQLPGYTQTEE